MASNVPAISLNSSPLAMQAKVSIRDIAY
jgi:hypothetical protein